MLKSLSKDGSQALTNADRRTPSPPPRPQGRSNRNHHPLSLICRPPQPTPALERRRSPAARLAGRIHRLGRRLAGRVARYGHGRGAPGRHRPRPIRHCRYRAAPRIRSQLSRNEVGNFRSPLLGRIHPPLTGGAGGSLFAARMPEYLQHRSGQPIHLAAVHGRVAGGRGAGVHGRAWTMDGQRVH